MLKFNCIEKKEINDMLLKENNQISEKINFLKTNIFEKKQTLNKSTKLMKKLNEEINFNKQKIEKISQKINFRDYNLEKICNIEKQKNEENYEIEKSTKEIKIQINKETNKNINNETNLLKTNERLSSLQEEILKAENIYQEKKFLFDNFTNKEKMKNESIFELEKKIKEVDWNIECKKVKFNELLEHEKKLNDFVKMCIGKIENNQLDRLKTFVEDQNLQIDQDLKNISNMLHSKKEIIKNL
jgi:hypothetical protein